MTEKCQQVGEGSLPEMRRLVFAKGGGVSHAGRKSMAAEAISDVLSAGVGFTRYCIYVTMFEFQPQIN